MSLVVLWSSLVILFSSLQGSSSPFRGLRVPLPNLIVLVRSLQLASAPARQESAIALGRHALASFTLPNSEWAARGFGVKPNGEMRSAEQILNVPRATLHEIEVRSPCKDDVCSQTIAPNH
eukprot:6174131-Pleurochrysis_carterae.AAC.5